MDVDVPLIPIETPEQVIHAKRWSKFLAIKTKANIAAWTHVNFGRAGEVRIRFGGIDVPFRRLGLIGGDREGGHLSVGVYLPKSDVEVTLLCDYPDALAMQLRVVNEFDFIAIGTATVRLEAFPIMAAAGTANILAWSMTDRGGTLSISVAADEFQKTYTNTKVNTIYASETPQNSPLQLPLKKNPSLQIVGSNVGVDQREVHLQVSPEPRV